MWILIVWKDMYCCHCFPKTETINKYSHALLRILITARKHYKHFCYKQKQTNTGLQEYCTWDSRLTHTGWLNVRRRLSYDKLYSSLERSTNIKICYPSLAYVIIIRTSMFLPYDLFWTLLYEDLDITVKGSKGSYDTISVMILRKVSLGDVGF